MPTTYYVIYPTTETTTVLYVILPARTDYREQG
jgi:hypothetical protein